MACFDGRVRLKYPGWLASVQSVDSQTIPDRCFRGGGWLPVKRPYAARLLSREWYSGSSGRPWLWTPVFPFPICTLAGQSIFGKIAFVGSFAPLLVSPTSEVAYEPLFVKTYLSPRLTGVIPLVLRYEERFFMLFWGTNAWASYPNTNKKHKLR